MPATSTSAVTPPTQSTPPRDHEQSGTLETPINLNGPQCCHCGWRGGGHDSTCPF
ncbi:hypothetical protein C8J57DRAFT_1276047, partial [Mycena rebaudengoi]